MCFSLDKFKNSDSIESTTSGWFGHEDARRKRGEITRLIRQTSEVARAAMMVEEPIFPDPAEPSKLKLETESKNKRHPPCLTKLPADMKVIELQEALKSRGLPKSGKKIELIRRLHSYLEAETEPSSQTQTFPQKRKILLDMMPNKRAK